MLAKRIFDLTLLTLGAPFILAVLALLSLLVRSKLGSPIFFNQDRPGLDGKIFRLVKFRSMTDGRDETGKLLPDADRLTRFGKFLRASSLDELPEIMNILAGEMSFVGPRPLLEEYLPLYSKEQARRHDVLPGITGWAQINGRNALSWDEKFSLDLHYVDHRNLWLDLKILIATVITILRRDGVSASDHATMPRFKGSGNGSQ